MMINSNQASSVVTTAIANIDNIILDADKGDPATITFTTYPSQPSNRFDRNNGFLRNVQANSDNVRFEIAQEQGIINIIPTKGGLAEITVTADLYSTNFGSMGSYVSEPTQAEFTYYIPIRRALRGISLSPENITLAPNSSIEVSVIYTPEDASNKRVIWTSSAPDLVSVEPGDTMGTATITALVGTSESVNITATSLDGNYTATMTVSIEKPAQLIAMKLITEYDLYPGLGTFHIMNPNSGAVVKYPGIAVSADGTMSQTIISPDEDYRLGVSLLNTLISGLEASSQEVDFTSAPLYMVEGDLNNDNVIDGTDYTILVQRMHFGSGLSDYGLVGDLNYDGVVDDLDLMLFNSPVVHTGEPRFMQRGFDMTDGTAETQTTATDSHTATRSSALQIEPSASGSYKVSFKEATEPANMLQLSLTGDIYGVSPTLPEGYKLIGEHYDDGRTTVAIGNTARDGVSIPAAIPLLSVQAASEPRIDYSRSALQKTTEDGVIDLPLTGGSSSLIDVPTPAAPARQSGSGGSSSCNTGLGVFALLAAVPLIFTRKR